MTMLFEAVRIKDLFLKNRIMIPPMASRISTDKGIPTKDTIQYYLPLANSGAGLAVMEHHAVHPRGRARINQLLIDREEVIPYQKELIGAFVSKEMPVFLQINHAGSLIHDRVLLDNGWIPKGPSSIQHPMSDLDYVPESFSFEEISMIPALFAAAASRGLEAGYSGIEIHAAHGYLLGQFLSPKTNRRSDAYGGTLRNRTRLVFEVYESVRAVVREKTPLSIRLGMADSLPNAQPSGQTIEEGVWVARELSLLGVDLINLSGNMCGYQGQGEAWFAPFCRRIKEVSGLTPIVCTGGIKTRAKAQELLEKGCCDLVGIGRALRINPSMVQSWKNACLQGKIPCK